MFWKRLPLSRKLFAAIAGIATLIVVFMALMVGLSMRSGFSAFLAEEELGRFDALVTALQRAHTLDRPGWPELAASREAWHDFVRRNLRPIGGGPRPGGPLRPPSAPAPDPLTVRAGPPPHPPPPGTGPPGGDPLQIGRRLSLLDAEGALVAGAPRYREILARRPIMVVAAGSERQVVGWLALSALPGRPIAADSVFLNRQLLTLGLSALLAVVLSAIAAFFLARTFLAPVHAVAAGARRLVTGEYDTRLETTRRDELGDLVADFNALAAGLDAAQKAERQWISDTSHELQTPLAVLRAQIEALQDGVRKPDASALDALHGSVMRLSLLVGDINLLARGREGALVLDRRDEDLHDLVAEAVESVRPVFDATDLLLDFVCAGNGLVSCDRLRIRQVLDNLLENARRYTAAPGRVSVRVEDKGRGVTLCVADSPPAPPPDAYDRLFDRFYRVEASRDRRHGGSGLGLAICRAIVEAHGGSISAAPSDLGGLAVRVDLPRGGEEP
ncbi:MAG: ATP-binding protein [Pseudomonadota bacterium]